ncbi:MAG: hypothetical protein R2831_02075 [Chitinophagaceae bacterium]
MEFRIAPLLISIFNLIYILFINPNINESIPLASVANIFKMLLPFILLLAMSMGTFFRHDFYSKKFKIAFWVLNSISLVSAVYYIIAIKQQHL